MSIQAVAWALEQEVNDPAAKLVLISLANAYNQQRHRCFPTVRQIMKEAGISERGARRKVQMLVHLGLLTIERSYDDTGRQQSNEYILTAFREGANLTGGGCQHDRGEGAKGDRGEGASCGTPLKKPEEIPEEISLGASAPSEPASPSKAKPAQTSTEDRDFEALWAVYPKREGPNPKKPARLAFGRALKRGVPFDLLMAEARRLAAHHPKPSRFCPQTVTWLNQDRATDTAEVPKPPVVEDEAEWARRLTQARLGGKWWVDVWGRIPGHPECRAPAHLVRPSDGDLWREVRKSA